MRQSLLKLCLTIIVIISSFCTKAQIPFVDDSTHTRRLYPLIYYNNPSRIYIGIKYVLGRHARGDDPYGFEHSVQLRYSISQRAFSALYNARFNELFGKWNLGFNTYYSWLVWTNFFGLGNETKKLSGLDYYRLSTGEYAAFLDFNRTFGQHHYVSFVPFIQGIEVFTRSGKYVDDNYLSDNNYYFEHHIYTGLMAGYTYQNVDDLVLPTRGGMFFFSPGYIINTFQTDKSFVKLQSVAQGFIPLVGKFGLSIRVGGALVSGTPEFYQNVSLGGPMNLRGYYLDRYWGSSMYYNDNELRFITNYRVGKFTGKIGLLALFDDGRVWVKNDSSSVIHYGYGGGILISPGHRFTASVTYAKGEEASLFQFTLSKLLNIAPHYDRIH